jgi:hypothetical protein
MSTSSNKVERMCGLRDCKNVGIHLCSGCGEEIYCSKECQKKDWSDHKLACKLAFKPEAAAIVQSFDALSVKQLKNLLRVKAATLDPKKKSNVMGQLESIVEKPQLLKLVKQYVQPSEIEGLLTNNPLPPQPTIVHGNPNDPHAPMTQGGNGGANMAGVKGKRKQVVTSTTKQVGGMGNPTPEQLKEQAKLMRKNPDLVRKSNPFFAKMTNQQISQYAEQLEKVA